MSLKVKVCWFYATGTTPWLTKAMFYRKHQNQMGGIRVINNTGHWLPTIRFYKIKGEALKRNTIMNAPKSSLNRYNQVTDVVIAHNS
jgi:hypothetical protein